MKKQKQLAYLITTIALVIGVVFILSLLVPIFSVKAQLVDGVNIDGVMTGNDKKYEIGVSGYQIFGYLLGGNPINTSSVELAVQSSALRFASMTTPLMQIYGLISIAVALFLVFSVVMVVCSIVKLVKVRKTDQPFLRNRLRWVLYITAILGIAIGVTSIVLTKQAIPKQSQFFSLNFIISDGIYLFNILSSILFVCAFFIRTAGTKYGATRLDK